MRRVLAAGVAVAVAGGAAVLVARDDDHEGDRLAITRTPETYRIDFEVREFAGGVETVATEVVLVRRPFDARTERIVDGRRTALDIQTFGRRSAQSEGDEEAVVVVVEPGPPEADLQPHAALDTLDTLEPRGQRTVAGRRCQVYRVASPEAGDICVDEAGLVIAEERTVDGRVVARRTATDVDEDPDIPPDAFTIVGDPVPVLAGGGAIQRVTDDSRPPDAGFWGLDVQPSGFDHRGRYVVSPPSGEPRPTQAGVADVWVRGPSVLVVENGGTIDGSAAFGDEPAGETVDLGDLGRGVLVVDLRASEVRVSLAHGRYVRVYGTLPPEDLVAIAGRLALRPGGTITTVPDPATD